MESENFVVIQGWMRKELNLSGNELIAYAVIYGFSQDNVSSFSGSAAYIANWCGISRRAVMSILKSLTERNLIEKKDVINNGVKLCNYSAKTSHGMKKLHRGYEETSQGGYEETSHHNIDIQKDRDIVSAKSRDSRKNDEQFLVFYQSYPKKTNKTDARKTFNKLIKSGVSLDSILSKLTIYKKQIEKDQTDIKYIKNPQRFLNCLEDYETEEEKKPVSEKRICPSCGSTLSGLFCKTCFTQYNEKMEATF